MEVSNQRGWQARLAVMLILGVAATCVAALMWWKAPAASPQEATSPEASFVVRCDFSHGNYDDPIVRPGVDGEVAKDTDPHVHFHHFFGNTSTDADSTHESLRAAGTTCLNPDDKSAYWIPAVKWTNTKGTRTLEASRAIFYYRADDKAPGEVQPHPAGLKVVPDTHVRWKCAHGTFRTSPPTRCSNGTLVVLIRFPDCSDGTLDSADHRSHMAYAVKQGDGTKQCPSTHATPVPALSMDVRFSIPTTSGSVRLSSGKATTMHADFFNAWDQDKLAALVDSCINAYPFSPANPKPVECKATG